jgi:hypothetical protein
VFPLGAWHRVPVHVATAETKIMVADITPLRITASNCIDKAEVGLGVSNRLARHFSYRSKLQILID